MAAPASVRARAPGVAETVRVARLAFAREASAIANFARGSFTPLLGAVRVRASDGLLTLSATDGTTTVTATVPASDGELDVLVSPKELSAAARAAAGDNIRLHTGETGFALDSTAQHTTVPVIGAKHLKDGYPRSPTRPAARARLDRTTMHQALSTVSTAATVPNDRPILEALQLVFDGEHLVQAAASDGYRVAVYDLPGANGTGDREVVQLHKTVADRMLDFLSRGREVEIGQGEHGGTPLIYFASQGRSVATTPYLGNRFPYEKHTDAPTTGTANLPTRELTGIAAEAKRLGTNAVRVDLGEDQVQLTIGRGENQSERTVPARVNGPEHSVLFNAEFLTDFARLNPHPNTRIAYNTGQTPALLTGAENADADAAPGLRYLLMPAAPPKIPHAADPEPTGAAPGFEVSLPALAEEVRFLAAFTPADKAQRRRADPRALAVNLRFSDRQLTLTVSDGHGFEATSTLPASGPEPAEASVDARRLASAMNGWGSGKQVRLSVRKESLNLRAETGSMAQPLVQPASAMLGEASAITGGSFEAPAFAAALTDAARAAGDAQSRYGHVHVHLAENTAVLSASDKRAIVARTIVYRPDIASVGAKPAAIDQAIPAAHARLIAKSLPAKGNARTGFCVETDPRVPGSAFARITTGPRTVRVRLEEISRGPDTGPGPGYLPVLRQLAPEPEAAASVDSEQLRTASRRILNQAGKREPIRLRLDEAHLTLATTHASIEIPARYSGPVFATAIIPEHLRTLAAAATGPTLRLTTGSSPLRPLLWTAASGSEATGYQFLTLPPREGVELHPAGHPAAPPAPAPAPTSSALPTDAPEEPVATPAVKPRPFPPQATSATSPATPDPPPDIDHTPAPIQPPPTQPAPPPAQPPAGHGQAPGEPEDMFEAVSDALDMELLAETEAPAFEPFWDAFQAMTEMEGQVRDVQDGGGQVPWQAAAQAAASLAQHARTLIEQTPADASEEVSSLGHLALVCEEFTAAVDAHTSRLAEPAAPRTLPGPDAPAVERALALAERGLAVFPITPGEKEPPLVRFTRAASSDPDAVRAMFEHRPTANIGVATGASRLLVLDLDVKPERGQDGLASLAALARGRKVPRTFTVGSASGGQHLYFALPPGASVRNSVDRLGDNLDVRGAGGYIVAPTSRLTNPPGVYVLEHDAPIALAPDWLLDEVAKQAAPAGAQRVEQAPGEVKDVAVKDPAESIALAVSNAVKQVAEARVGQRNTILYNQARRIGLYLDHNPIDEAGVRTQLFRAALQADPKAGREEQAKIHTTIGNGFRDGRAHPVRLRAESARDSQPPGRSADQPAAVAAPLRAAAATAPQQHAPTPAGQAPAPPLAPPTPITVPARPSSPSVPVPAPTESEQQPGGPGANPLAPAAPEPALARPVAAPTPAAPSAAAPDAPEVRYQQAEPELTGLLHAFDRLTPDQQADALARLAPLVEQVARVIEARGGAVPQPANTRHAAREMRRSLQVAGGAAPPAARRLGRLLGRLTDASVRGEDPAHQLVRNMLRRGLRSIAGVIQRNDAHFERDPRLAGLVRSAQAAADTLAPPPGPEASSNTRRGAAAAQRELADSFTRLLSTPVAAWASADARASELLYTLDLACRPAPRWPMTENGLHHEAAWRRRGADAAEQLRSHLDVVADGHDLDAVRLASIAARLNSFADNLDRAAIPRRPSVSTSRRAKPDAPPAASRITASSLPARPAGVSR